MNEEPLRIIPPEWRAKAIDELRLSNDKFKVRIEGDMDPARPVHLQGPDATLRGRLVEDGA